MAESLPRVRLFRREIFGSPDCPLLYRWTLAKSRDDDGPKLMLHWFLPDRFETDLHDHPRDFVTVVLFGSYRDVDKDGHVDRVHAPTVRRRPAEHAHRTLAGRHGCLTVAYFRRRRRRWGFWHNGQWYPWQMYERVFGSRFRCD